MLVVVVVYDNDDKDNNNNNNNNNNNYYANVNVYRAVIVTIAITRVHPVLLMNTDSASGAHRL